MEGEGPQPCGKLTHSAFESPGHQVHIRTCESLEGLKTLEKTKLVKTDTRGSRQSEEPHVRGCGL